MRAGHEKQGYGQGMLKVKTKTKTKTKQREIQNKDKTGSTGYGSSAGKGIKKTDKSKKTVPCGENRRVFLFLPRAPEALCFLLTYSRTVTDSRRGAGQVMP